MVKLGSKLRKNNSLTNFLSGIQLNEKLSATDRMIWKCVDNKCIIQNDEYSIENVQRVTVRNCNYRYSKCNKCGTFVRKYAFDQKAHCLSHLAKKECGQYKFYFCLLCHRSNNRFIEEHSVKRHLQKNHKINNALLGVHYRDESNKFKHLLQKVTKECFYNSEEITKQSKRSEQKPNSIKCSKCCKEIQDIPSFKKCHVLSHVRSETEYKWIFQCMICPKNRHHFETMYKLSLRKHFVSFHNTVKPVSGSNYIDRMDEVFYTIGEMVNICFAGQIPYSKELQYKTPKSNGHVTQSPKNCLKCGMSISKLLCRRMSHTIKHLKMSHQIDWVYKCLLCHSNDPLKTLHYNSVISHIMRIHSISRSDCTIGVHYQSRRNEFYPLIKLEMEECFKHTIHSLGSINTTIGKKKIQKLTHETECKVCNASVINRSYHMKDHASIHIKYETKIRNLFECLMCSKKEWSSEKNIRGHIYRVHHVVKAKQDVHYLNNTNQYKKQLELLYKKCFPDYNIS